LKVFTYFGSKSCFARYSAVFKFLVYERNISLRERNICREQENIYYYQRRYLVWLKTYIFVAQNEIQLRKCTWVVPESTPDKVSKHLHITLISEHFRTTRVARNVFEWSLWTQSFHWLYCVPLRHNRRVQIGKAVSLLAEHLNVIDWIYK